MRKLSAVEELDVAGGYDWAGEVVAYGARPGFFGGTFFNFAFEVPIPWDFVDGGSGGGGGEEPETPRDTPCVTDKPTKHDNILDIHKGAIDLKVKAYEKYGTADWEHVGIVWKMPGGDVRTTDAFSSFNRVAIEAGAMWDAIDQVPDGAIILGLFHSQPDNGKMSDKDWNAHRLLFGNPDSPRMIGDGNVLLSNIGRGITADPNGLSYVHDKSTGTIHVYDKSDMGKDKLECHVNERRGG
jgi:hypothetical protein